MALIFVTTDNTKWGAGQGSQISATQGDNNFWQLLQRIVFLEDHPAAAISLDHFETVGDQFYAHLTDSSILGPYTLPSLNINPVGVWLPSTLYAKFDLLSYGGGVYLVSFNHTSAPIFDPGANDGNGHNFYQLWFQALRGAPVDTAELSTDGTWTPVVGDEFTYWRFPDIGTVVVPSHAEQPFSKGDEINLRQVFDDDSFGGLVIEWPTDITVNVPFGFIPELFGKHATATLKNVDGDDEWDLMGLLKSA
jgi:hypothetical protein